MDGAVVRPAPAKINLALHVTGRRADGFHMLETLVVFTDFGDRITVCAAGRDDFSVDGPFAAAVPADDGNLVIRAREALRGAYAGRCGPVRIQLEKTLPAASGVGGGSSDAAATLKALAALWELPAGPRELAEIAAPLGADLPMCIHARPLMARGIGEIVEPVDAMPALPMVLVNPGAAVATPDVFRRLGKRDNPPLPPLPDRLGARELTAWLRACRNDLEAPALDIAPAIADALASLGEAGARLARMSGSGATCFGLFGSDAEAGRAAAAIGKGRPGWFVVATRSGGSDAGT